MKNWWESIGKKLAVIGGILALLSSIFAGYFWMENHYASAEELGKIKQRLEYKITDDQYKAIQQRIWSIEDRYNGKKMPEDISQTYRQLKSNEELLKNQLMKMEKLGVQ